MQLVSVCLLEEFVKKGWLYFDVTDDTQLIIVYSGMISLCNICYKHVY